MTAFNHFARWLDECGDAQAVSAGALDRQLELFAEWVFTTGGGSGRQTAACARFACIWLNPRLKGELPLSLAATGQSAWYRAAGRVVQSHRPVPWPVACLVAHHLTAAGHTGAGVAVIVAFDALLRISEAASLRLEDVADTGMVDARLPSRVVLSVRAPKTGDDSKGERQSVTLRDPVAVTLLREFVASQRATSSPGQPLFGLDAHTLERLFCDAADALGGSVHFTWHSLRHGGATYLSMAQVSAEEICAHGRWVAIGSLKRYLQTGAAVVASHGLGVDVMARAERVAAALRSACA